MSDPGAMTIPIRARFMMISKVRPMMDGPVLSQDSAGLRTVA
ncbi:hypothetical protein HMPREF1979_02573 [Actinomyces johnsonii F0542]|uniref:Uncharacterized protein n=1 Tax=Actinomyces johnsonii F0542 TaxID=1321818 RepID=U1Q3E7_9ACTO|nr:hypothetical protein HMPREF1979_02573 [Actinomyces johnsonii F0542]